MEEKRISKMDKVKEILINTDPAIAVTAIMRLSDADSSEVKEIKEYLSAHKTEAIKLAIAELDQEMVAKEVDNVYMALKSYDLALVKETAKIVAISNAKIAKAFYCADVVTCTNNIEVMDEACPNCIGSCMGDIYAHIDRRASRILY